ncbi:ArsR family transcriptional regulator [Halobacteriales archaeon QS_8_69_26]|nr:MAG: ArsR family transcriptional regulator [Halobacteriales archaeon QS_8_69_26]
MGTTDTERAVDGELDGAGGFSDPEFRSELRDLPPSAKLVAKVLETNHALSQGEIAEATLLPDRTVRYALNRLQEVELVGARHSFQDARKQVYFIDG